MRFEQLAIRAHEGAGSAGEKIGQKAVDFAVEKAPDSIRHQLKSAVKWCRKHPYMALTTIVVGRAFVGILMGVLAKAAEPN